MKDLCKHVKKYKEQMNILDFALLKICLTSMGMLIGIGIPKPCKKKAAICLSALFAFTYAPLVTKFLNIVLSDSKNYLKE